MACYYKLTTLHPSDGRPLSFSDVPVTVNNQGKWLGLAVITWETTGNVPLLERVQSLPE